MRSERPSKWLHSMAQARSIAGYKAINMNVMYSSMEITDEFYSNLIDGEIQNRIGSLGKSDQQTVNNDQDDFRQFQEFLEWQKSHNHNNKYKTKIA
jgi:hypothetical protein